VGGPKGGRLASYSVSKVTMIGPTPRQAPMCEFHPRGTTGLVFGMGADVNVRSWLVAIVIVLTGFAGAVRAQDALVLDTYTCGNFLADLGDWGNSARLRRSLMMISWAAGYAAARHNEATGSLEVIAATLGDVCRNSPAEKAAKAITDKINETANRQPAREAATVPSSAPPAPASPVPAATAVPVPPAAGSSGRSFTIYTGRDMEGGGYYKERGISLDRCESLCRKDNRCQAYSYDAWNRYCFLKASVNPLRLEPRSVTFVIEGASVTYDEREPVIQRRSQKAFPNAPYLQANAQSYGDCSQRCLKDKRCEAFNFYQFARRCSLIEKPRAYADDWAADLGIKVQPEK
jgi:PAN domain